MAKLNYQKLSRETSLKRQPILDGKHSPKKTEFNAPVKMNDTGYILSFGQYKGKRIKEIPTSYIIWAIRTLERPKVDIFIRELERRTSTK